MNCFPFLGDIDCPMLWRSCMLNWKAVLIKIYVFYAVEDTIVKAWRQEQLENTSQFWYLLSAWGSFYTCILGIMLYCTRLGCIGNITVRYCTCTWYMALTALKKRGRMLFAVTLTSYVPVHKDSLVLSNYNTIDDYDSLLLPFPSSVYQNTLLCGEFWALMSVCVFMILWGTPWHCHAHLLLDIHHLLRATSLSSLRTLKNAWYRNILTH